MHLLMKILFLVITRERGEREREMKMKAYLLFVVVPALCVILGLLPQGAATVWKTRLTKRGCVGINYGRLGDNLPSPVISAKLIKKLGACYVKIYDHDQEVISALADAGLQVVITATNQELGDLASSLETAERWVANNVLTTAVTMVMVGNEIYSGSQTLWPFVVPAMHNIEAALVKHIPGHVVKVTTSLAMDALTGSYPPSAGRFKNELVPYLRPLLEILSETGSYLFLDAYPFLAWQSDPHLIPFNYALMQRKEPLLDDGVFRYTHLLEAQIDATVAACAKLGYPKVKVALSETGWPTKGAYGANMRNARIFNGVLVANMLSGKGTPRRRNVQIPTFIFSLFNENQKPGPDTERNWGLLYPNGKPVYPISLSVKPTSPYESNAEPRPQGHRASRKQWCVAKTEVGGDAPRLQVAIDYACQNGASCADIQTGGVCEQPGTYLSRASFAFNSYWQNMKEYGGTCDFDGAAMLTNVDPSYARCYYVYNENNQINSEASATTYHLKSRILQGKKIKAFYEKPRFSFSYMKSRIATIIGS